MQDVLQALNKALRELPAKKDGEEKQAHTYQAISHSIGYLDIIKKPITEVKWPGPFDLNKARYSKQGDVDPEKPGQPVEPPVFRVHTTLSTSIPTSEYSQWYSDGIKRVTDEGILDNPDIFVSVAEIRITICSSALIKAITTVVSNTGLLSLENNVLQFKDPFQLIAHHFTEFEDLCANPVQDGIEDPELTASHLDMLLGYLKPFYGSRITEERERHARNVCTYRMMWLLFKPGVTVYSESEGRLAAYVVQDVEVDNSILHASPEDRLKPYVIHLWNLDFDGRYVGRCATSVTIGEFDGERQITSLKVIPCEFIDRGDDGTTRRNMEEKGRRWYGLLCGGQVYYSGDLLGASLRQVCIQTLQAYPWLKLGFQFEGRIYIDPASHYQVMTKIRPVIGQIDDFGEGLAMCPCVECVLRRPHPPKGFRWGLYDVLDPAKVKDLTLEDSPEGSMHRYMFCNWRTSGFVLNSRTWGKFYAF